MYRDIPLPGQFTNIFLKKCLQQDSQSLSFNNSFKQYHTQNTGLSSFGNGNELLSIIFLKPNTFLYTKIGMSIDN